MNPPPTKISKVLDFWFVNSGKSTGFALLEGRRGGRFYIDFSKSAESDFSANEMEDFNPTAGDFV